MFGYSRMKQGAERFLGDNPEIVTLTIRRPLKPKKLFYLSYGSESNGRVPSTCSKVEEILLNHLKDDGSMRLTDATGRELSIADLRAAIFQSLHDDITTVFRREFEAALEQKFRGIKKLETIAGLIREGLDEMRTEIPVESVDAKRAERRRRTEEAEVLVEDEEDDI